MSLQDSVLYTVLCSVLVSASNIKLLDNKDDDKERNHFNLDNHDYSSGYNFGMTNPVYIFGMTNPVTFRLSLESSSVKRRGRRDIKGKHNTWLKRG